MNILWVTNIPFNIHHRLLGNSNVAQSGGWINAAYDCLKSIKTINLHIATLADVSDIIFQEDECGNIFYLVPGGPVSLDYDYNNKVNIRWWSGLCHRVSPDIVQLWGTEFPHGLAVLDAIKETPCLVYMQGMMSQINRHFYSGISVQSMLKAYTLRDLLKGGLFKEKKIAQKRANIEASILKRAKSVIVENDWCAYHCESIIGKSAKIYRSHLPINEVFKTGLWSIEKAEPYSIMINAGGPIIKGHHMLFKALAIVAQKNPSVKLYIPGGNSLPPSMKMRKQRITGYTVIQLDIIRKYNLYENICFLGKLSAGEMKKRLEKVRVYVTPSAIENHSSSLIEAMMVGTPVISSYVGGTGELINPGINGLLYRFDEPEVLAGYICRIFEDDEMALRLSNNGKAIMDSRNPEMLKQEFSDIYNSVMTNYKK